MIRNNSQIGGPVSRSLLCFPCTSLSCQAKQKWNCSYLHSCLFYCRWFPPFWQWRRKESWEEKKASKRNNKEKTKRKRNINNNNNNSSNYEGLMSGYRPMNMKEERIYHEHPHTNNFSSLLLSSHVHNRNETILNGHCQDKKKLSEEDTTQSDILRWFTATSSFPSKTTRYRPLPTD